MPSDRNDVSNCRKVEKAWGKWSYFLTTLSTDIFVIKQNTGDRNKHSFSHIYRGKKSAKRHTGWVKSEMN